MSLLQVPGTLHALAQDVCCVTYNIPDIQGTLVCMGGPRAILGAPFLELPRLDQCCRDLLLATLTLHKLPIRVIPIPPPTFRRSAHQPVASACVPTRPD